MKDVAVFLCDRSGVMAEPWAQAGLRMLRDSLELFAACYTAGRWSGAPFMIENPIGKFSDHMGPPDQMFQPWQYGDPWKKKTCLWTGGGFVMPAPLFTEEPPGTDERIWRMSPSDERADLRGQTPPGFARAVFLANGQDLSKAAA